MPYIFLNEKSATIQGIIGRMKHVPFRFWPIFRSFHSTVVSFVHMASPVSFSFARTQQSRATLIPPASPSLARTLSFSHFMIAEFHSAFPSQHFHWGIFYFQFSLFFFSLFHRRSFMNFHKKFALFLPSRVSHLIELPLCVQLSTFPAWKIDKLFWFHLILLHLIRYITAFSDSHFLTGRSERKMLLWFSTERSTQTHFQALTRADFSHLLVVFFALALSKLPHSMNIFFFFRSLSLFRSFHSIKSHHIFSLAAGCIEKTQKYLMKLLKTHN